MFVSNQIIRYNMKKNVITTITGLCIHAPQSLFTQEVPKKKLPVFASARAGYSGIGYAIPFLKSKTAVTLGLAYEYSNRNADLTGIPETVKYTNSQVSFNVGLSF